MVLDPVDSASAGGLATRAKEAGIPVVSYDRLILDADLDYYVAFDSVDGRQAAGRVARPRSSPRTATPQGPIVKINGDPQGQQRRPCSTRASTEVFEKDGVEIAKEFDTPDWLPENAQREMEQAITALGKDGFAAVYAANDGTGRRRDRGDEGRRDRSGDAGR